MRRIAIVLLAVGMILSTAGECANTTPAGCRERQNPIHHGGNWCKRWTGENPNPKPKSPGKSKPKNDACTPGDKRIIC
jgi:hypothetical protein